MGADVSVFEEGELEESFWKYHGPNNESFTDLFKRTIKGNINQRKCTDYIAADIVPSDYSGQFDVNEFRLVSEGVPINCLYFNKQLPEGCPASMLNSDICVVYIHTNTRAAVDAVELLPLCRELQCDLAAFDLPGCGKSGGITTESMAHALHALIQYIAYAKMKDKVVVWARGMGTGVAIEYATDDRYTSDAAIGGAGADPVVYMVLDSPFVSTERMIADIVERVRDSGYYIPSITVNLSKYVTKRAFSHYYKGVDPLKVHPHQQIMVCRRPLVPCHVFAATNDDYVSSAQGHEIAEAWTGPCGYGTYCGGHFGVRDVAMVTSVACAIYEICREGAAGSVEGAAEMGLRGGGVDDSITVEGGHTGSIESHRERGESIEGQSLFDADDIMKLDALQKEVSLATEDTLKGIEETQKGSDGSGHTSPERPPSRLSRFTGLNTFSPNFKSSGMLFASTSATGMRKAVSSSQISAMDREVRSSGPTEDGTDDSTSTGISSEKKSSFGMFKSKSMLSFGKYQKGS